MSLPTLRSESTTRSSGILRTTLQSSAYRPDRDKNDTFSDIQEETPNASRIINNSSEEVVEIGRKQESLEQAPEELKNESSGIFEVTKIPGKRESDQEPSNDSSGMFEVTKIQNNKIPKLKFEESKDKVDPNDGYKNSMSAENMESFSGEMLDDSVLPDLQNHERD